tara:strand:+ start:33 stop:2486 length:2454 start_codon:yes stop_codon:yes gene_type:complete
MPPNTNIVNIPNLRKIKETHADSWLSDLILYSFDRMEYEKNKNGEYKKKAIGLLNNWSQLEESIIHMNHNCCACLTGKKSNIIVLDFDDINLYNEFVFKYNSLNNVPYVKTKKGYHLYFKWNDKYVNLPSKIGKLDIQGNGKQVYFPPTNYEYIENHFLNTFQYEMFNYENNELTEIPEDLYNDLKKEEKTNVKLPTKEIDSINDNEKIVNLINPKTLGNFEDWKKIIFAMKFEGFSEQFAKETSNRAIGSFEPLTPETWEKFWNNNMEQCTMGTLKFYASRDNPSEYFNLTFKPFHLDENLLNDVLLNDNITDTYFAELYNFLKPNHTVYVRDDDIYYTWIKNKWVQEDEKGLYSRNNIRIDLECYFKKLINKFVIIKKEKDCEEFETKCNNIIRQLNNRISLINKTSQQNNIWTELRAIYLKNSLSHNIQFNMNPDVIGFDNKKYNFKTEKFEEIVFDDYISFTSGYDYQEPTDEQYEKIKELFIKAFPDEERRKCYISIMYNSLIGGAKEKFCVANGTGGNCKGVLNELLKKTLGEYATDADTSILTDKQKPGANPELAKLDKKRLVILKEPNENDKIRCDMLKKLVGNSELSGARQIYSKKTGIVLNATMLFEVNVKLGFDGKLQDDMRRRLLDIKFESTFTDDEHLLNDPTAKYVYKKDAYFTTEDFKETHCCALFKYLVTESQKTIYVPLCVKEDTDKYIDDNDNIYNWVLENYELTQSNQDVIKIKDMYDLYKNSDEYQNTYKKDRKTLKSFSNEIITHKYLRSKYNEELRFQGTDEYNWIKKIYNVAKIRSCLQGIKLIKHDCCIDDFD